MAIGFLGLIAPSECRADPLLQFDPDPNQPLILGINNTLTYTKSSGMFHAEALPISYTSPVAPDGFFSSGLMTVDLKVNQNGSLVSGGTGVTLTGSLDVNNDGTDDVSGNLLTGVITAFGSDLPGPPSRLFNGFFQVTGGALTGSIPLSGGGSIFGGFNIGAGNAFIVTAENVNSGILGDFQADFSSNNGKLEFLGVVPEPGSLSLSLIAVVMIAGPAWLRGRVARRPPHSP